MEQNAPEVQQLKITSGCFWGASKIPLLSLAARTMNDGSLRQFPEKNPGVYDTVDVISHSHNGVSGVPNADMKASCRSPTGRNGHSKAAFRKRKLKKVRRWTLEDFGERVLQNASDPACNGVTLEHWSWPMCLPYLADYRTVLTSDKEVAGTSKSAPVMKRNGLGVFMTHRAEENRADSRVLDFASTEHYEGKPGRKGGSNVPVNGLTTSRLPYSHAPPRLSGSGEGSSSQEDTSILVEGKIEVASNTPRPRTCGHLRQREEKSLGRRSDKPMNWTASRQLDHVLEVYGNDNLPWSVKQVIGGTPVRGYKNQQARFCEGVARSNTCPSGNPRRLVGCFATVQTTERANRMETIVNTARDIPITFEEQIRRERQAHFRIMSMVGSTEMRVGGTLVVNYIHSVQTI